MATSTDAVNTARLARAMLPMPHAVMFLSCGHKATYFMIVLNHHQPENVRNNVEDQNKTFKLVKIEGDGNT